MSEKTKKGFKMPSSFSVLLIIIDYYGSVNLDYSSWSIQG